MRRPGTRPARALAAAARVVAAGIVASGLACAPPLFDADALEERHAALAALAGGPFRGHRLGDAMPYVLPSRDVATLFLCRWDPADAVPVSLPEDASQEALRPVLAALSAWEGAGLGVRFAPGAAPGRGIEIHFVEPDAADRGRRYAGDTIADCAVDPAALDAPHAERIEARLVFASVHLRRFDLDAIGRRVALREDERAGSALHEIGHALGFQGHAARGATAMVRDHHRVRLAGRRILAGEPHRDAALSPLYALPSGTVVARVALPPGRTALFDRAAAAARRAGWLGPFARVGDRDARLTWLSPRAEPASFLVFDVARSVRRPQEFQLDPTRGARDLASR